MKLICPHCGYGRDIPQAQTTATAAVNVLCPQCQKIFVFVPGAPGDPEPAGSEEAGVTADVVSTGVVTSDVDRPKAGFWIRGAAAFVDSLIVGSLQGGIVFLFAGLIGLIQGGYESESLWMACLAWLLGSAVGIVYYVYFTAFGGQTPGKMALRIKVIRTDGSPLSLGRALYRETLCKFVSGIILGIGYLLVAFDEKKQGLHDRMADTYVVRLERQG